MWVTKYPQSCLLFDKPGAGRVLVDPGGPATGRFAVDDFGSVDAVLYTHRHPDHLDPQAMAALAERGATLYGNSDVRSMAEGVDVEEVRDGQRLDVAGFDVLPLDLDHMPMVDGAPGPPNTGFLLDSSCFHPGDGISLPGLSAPTLAVPIAGPSASLRDAYRFIEQVGATRAIPVHYDVFPEDPAQLRARCDIAEIIVLESAERVELPDM